jgi:RNA 2',3'-cyclic 3'-phosphodiesterase
MRLFIAIELDDHARHAIAGEQTRLKAAFVEGDRSGLRWISPEHMHLTLAFLGEIDESRRQVVVEMMRRPIKGDRFAVVFGGLGVFPPRGAARVLWLGLASGVRQVMNVQQQVTERVARLGIPLEPRPFHPHLTLARWRTSHESARRHHGLPAAVQSDPVTRLDVEGVALIHSRLSQAGAGYTALCHSRLGDWVDRPLQSE